jgi:hypothetical protein
MSIVILDISSETSRSAFCPNFAKNSCTVLFVANATVEESFSSVKAGFKSNLCLRLHLVIKMNFLTYHTGSSTAENTLSPINNEKRSLSILCFLNSFDPLSKVLSCMSELLTCHQTTKIRI